uniref:Fasciclin domain-containing protein n=1 Tax=Roseihalotalea indica TaxID=2867963 RepID=A0AA49GMT3_9BACT|nr:fasciclin domain-containing protein [Tunicatimonas sp. TK19036]
MKYTTNLTALVSGVLLACTLMASAQVNIQWDKTYGGDMWDDPVTALPTEDGGYLLAGTSLSGISGNKTSPLKGGEVDYWLIKIDASGSKIWDKSIGGDGYDFLSAAFPTGDGNYLLAGTSSSSASGDKSEDTKGVDGEDFWIIKVDANGNKIWDKTIGSYSGESMTDAILTTDGGFLLVGYSYANASGDKSEDNKDEGDFNSIGDYWLVKTDALGNVMWDKTLGGGKQDFPQRAITTPDGGYLVIGYSESNISGDKSENSKGGSDYWLIKVDAQGNKLWDKTIGGREGDYLYNVLATSDGGYLLGGASISGVSGDKSEPNKGSSDYWVVKVDASGNKLWDKTIGGNDADGLRSIVPSADGGYLLGGTSFSNASGDKSEDYRGDPEFQSSRRADYWIVRIDANGNKLWDKTIGGSGSPLVDDGGGDFLEKIIGTSDGGYLLIGSSSAGISYEKTEPNQGEVESTDFWIVKIQEQAVPPVAVIEYVLLNAKTDQEIRLFKEGDLVVLSKLPRYNLNVQVQVRGQDQIGSVKFQLNSKTYIRNEAPYALFGAPNGNFASGTFQPGEYTLIATPYSEDNAQGVAGEPLEIQFEVVYRNTVADVIKRTSAFSQLLAGLNQAGLQSKLVGPGPYTVYAPTDEAFASYLSEQGISNVRKIPINTLRDLLKYHIVPYKIREIWNGLPTNTLLYQEAVYYIQEEDTFINEGKFIGAEVVASNGAVQMIDHVLIPPAETSTLMVQQEASASPSLEMVAVADPVANEVRVRTQGMENKTLAVTIMDYQGLYPQTYAYKLTGAQQEVVLDMRSYGPGLYILHAQVDQLRQSIKVEK